MKGNAKVIAELNKSLSSELTAIVQYMVQAETCQNWGYARLAAYLKRRAIEEMHHAEGVIERIVLFDSVPKVDVALPPKLGTNVEEHLKADLADEKEAVHDYNTAVKVCVEAGDNASREMFEDMIKDEEGQADFLESHLHAIEEMGIGTYLAQQLHAEKVATHW